MNTRTAAVTAATIAGLSTGIFAGLPTGAGASTAIRLPVAMNESAPPATARAIQSEPGSCYDRTFGPGSFDGCVAIIQGMINQELGQEILATDKAYGTWTTIGTLVVQRDEGLVMSGVWGPAEWGRVCQDMVTYADMGNSKAYVYAGYAGCPGLARWRF